MQKRHTRKKSKGISFCVFHVESDVEWAEWIAEELGDYTVPAPLVGRLGNRGDRIPDRLQGGVTLELPESNVGLSEEEKIQLMSFDFLIVVCSPKSANSVTIGERIRLYKSQGRSDRLLTAIIDGSPGASESGRPDLECFHPLLLWEIAPDGTRSEKRAEPLAADFRLNGRHRGWLNMDKLKSTLERGGMRAEQSRSACKAQSERLNLMKLKLLAGMLGIDLGELTQRETAYVEKQASGRRRMIAIGMATAMGLAATLHFGIGKLDVARHDAEIAEKAANESKRMLQSNGQRLELTKRASQSQADAARAAEERLKGLSLLQSLSGSADDVSMQDARSEAARHLAEAASLGDSIATLNLGRMLVTDPRDKAEVASGLEWLQKAAAMQGSKAEANEAKYLLARIFDEGKLVARDTAKAVMMSEGAASEGHALAMEQLAYMIERGLAGKERIPECLQWYRRAAEAGNPEGHFALYLMRLQGRPFGDLKPDREKAGVHLRDAVNAGSPRALHLVGKQTPSSSVPGSHDANFQNLERAAAAGLVDARITLAELHMTARDRQPNLEACRRQLDLCLEESLRTNNVKLAEAALSTAYRHGAVWSLGNETAILRWATRGSSLANEAMGDILQGAPNTIKDGDSFIKYMRAAAQSGNVSALYKLGSAALSGGLKRISKEEGLDLLIKAAGKNHPPSFYALSVAYREGKVVKRDWEKSSHYAKEAMKHEKVPNSSWSSNGPKINWGLYPIRFRPGYEPKERSWESAMTKVKMRAALGEEDRKHLDAFLSEFRPEAFLVSTVMDRIGLEKDVPAETLLTVGRKLLSTGHFDAAEKTLVRCVDEASWDERFDSEESEREMDKRNHRYQAASALAAHFKNRDTAKHAYWTLITAATSRTDRDAVRLAPLNPYRGGLKNLRLTRTDSSLGYRINQDTLRQAAMELEASALNKASLRSGFPPPGLRPPVSDEEAVNLMDAARRLMSESEFPEETEEALELLSRAANNAANQAAASRLAAECSKSLGNERAAFYWNLRGGLAKSPPGFSCHREASQLCLSYATGEGVEPDSLEAEKWMAIARHEIQFQLTAKAGIRRTDEDVMQSEARLKEAADTLATLNVRTSQTDDVVSVRCMIHRSLCNPDGRRKL